MMWKALLRCFGFESGCSLPTEIVVNHQTMIVCLPEEIIQDILFRLPVKCLIKCSSVCKSWKSVIKNSSFVRAHLSHINRGGTHFLLLHQGRCGTSPSMEEEVYSLHYDNHAFDEYCNIDFQILRTALGIGKQHLHVAGTCHGLVCLAANSLAKTSKYILWNPSIRKAVMLPLPGVPYTTHGLFEESIGFSFDALSSDYKVVRLVTVDSRDTLAEVYSLVRGSWRSLGSVQPSCQLFGTQPSAFCNGAIHWVVKRWSNLAYLYFILSFDVGSELFREITMPAGSIKYPFVQESRVSVSGDGNSLALFSTYETDDAYFQYFVDVWVLKDYCVEKSWTKLITVGPKGDIPKTLAFGKSSEVFLLVGNHFEKFKLVLVDHISRQIKKIETVEYKYCNSIYCYEESLVLLDLGNTVSY